MKAERSGITLLLGLLLLLCSIIGMLHAEQTTITIKGPSFTIPELPQAPQQTLPRRDLSADNDLISLFTQRPVAEVLHSLRAMIASESVENLVAALAVVPPSHVKQIRALIIMLLDQKLLPPEDIVVVIMGLVNAYKNEAQAVATLLNLFLEKPILQKTDSPIYLAADTIYKEAIPVLLQWADRTKSIKDAPNAWLSSLLDRAFDEIARKNNARALKNLMATGSAISRKQLSALLWHAVTHTHNEKLVDYLLSLRPDVNYHQEGHTILMQAVKSYDIEIIKKLLEAGAQFNVVIDPYVGSVLQLIIAMKNDELAHKKLGYEQRVQELQEIEDYLREKGAREVILS